MCKKHDTGHIFFMTSKEATKVSYDELLRDYKSATIAASRERALETLILEIKPLVEFALWDGASADVLSAHEREEAVDDALLEIIKMADNYTSDRGLTFHQYVTARNAPWRKSLNSATVRALNGGNATRAELDVLRIAFKIIQDYNATWGKDPDTVVLQELLNEYVVDQVRLKNKNLETQIKANNKSGFSAAIRNIETLLQSRKQEHPDTSEGGWKTVDLTHQENDLSETYANDALLESWEKLAGLPNDGNYTKAALEDARNRMSSPHAQWFHLVNETLISTNSK